MKKLIPTIGLVLVIWGWFTFNVFAATWTSPPFESPTTPLPEAQSSTYSSFDVQAHSRDSTAGFDGMQAQHSASCGGPPASHFVSSFADSVFVCNGHVMTAANAGGYGLIVLTPNQLLDCSSQCTIQWDMSTERMSIRDWPDIWVTPWADNLTLPFNAGDVDLQGVPRRGVHLDMFNTESAWLVKTINNYVETGYNNQWQTAPFNAGIVAGTNESAIRQTFRLTLRPNHVRIERIASSTASGAVYYDGNVNAFPTTDLVVQFAHHSYSPTKDGAGQPATWHWGDFQLNPSVGFNLINGSRLTKGGTVSFSTPAPQGAFLRFSAACRVNIDGVLANRQKFLSDPLHASSYFVPIAAGKQSFNITFSPDGYYNNNVHIGCYARDFAIWSKGGGSPPVNTPTPTSTPVVNTLTPSANTPTPVPNLVGTCEIWVVQQSGSNIRITGRLEARWRNAQGQYVGGVLDTQPAGPTSTTQAQCSIP